MDFLQTTLRDIQQGLYKIVIYGLDIPNIRLNDTEEK